MTFWDLVSQNKMKKKNNKKKQVRRVKIELGQWLGPASGEAGWLTELSSLP